MKRPVQWMNSNEARMYTHDEQQVSSTILKAIDGVQIRKVVTQITWSGITETSCIGNVDCLPWILACSGISSPAPHNI